MALVSDVVSFGQTVAFWTVIPAMVLWGLKNAEPAASLIKFVACLFSHLYVALVLYFFPSLSFFLNSSCHQSTQPARAVSGADGTDAGLVFTAIFQMYFVVTARPVRDSCSGLLTRGAALSSPCGPGFEA